MIRRTILRGISEGAPFLIQGRPFGGRYVATLEPAEDGTWIATTVEDSGNPWSYAYTAVGDKSVVRCSDVLCPYLYPIKNKEEY